MDMPHADKGISTATLRQMITSRTNPLSQIRVLVPSDAVTTKRIDREAEVNGGRSCCFMGPWCRFLSPLHVRVFLHCNVNAEAMG